ncbi:UNVERIFIED_CONTAM: hypothetical protein LBW93_03150 [Wolbachia endosymbiont of Nasonia longicornis]
MPILQQNALVTIYLKAFLLTITSINTSYATKPLDGIVYIFRCNHKQCSKLAASMFEHLFQSVLRK